MVNNNNSEGDYQYNRSKLDTSMKLCTDLFEHVKTSQPTRPQLMGLWCIG